VVKNTTREVSFVQKNVLIMQRNLFMRNLKRNIIYKMNEPKIVYLKPSSIGSSLGFIIPKKQYRLNKNYCYRIEICEVEKC